MFITRGSEGLKKYTYPECKEVSAVFQTTKRCSTVCMSQNGEVIAVCDGEKTRVYNIRADKVILELDRPRTMLVALSPYNTHVITWKQYVVDENTPANTPNVEVWSISEPQDTPVYSYVKRSQVQWELLWTEDEKYCARLCNAEVQFFLNNDFTKVESRIQRDKIGGVFVPPGTNPYHVALYVPSIKGSHAFVQLYCYGAFEKTAAIANRSFAKVDSVDIKFNKTGKYGIIMAANDVDKSGTSYYGQTLLYFISTRGESNQIILDKNGPVYSAQWNPSRDEFIILYGFMPCKAAVYNTKCDVIHNFGENHYNEILFNPQGNMVGLCGFGNLRGKMKFYDTTTKKMLSEFTASDTTYFEWAPSGDIFITGTLSPRLRQDNEFKIWNVKGKILHHHRVDKDVQLWQLKWVNSPTVLPAPPIPAPLTSKEIAAAKPQAYRPPSSRSGGPQATRKLIDHGSNLPNVNDGVYKPHSGNQVSKQALKNQRKRENRAANKATDAATTDSKDFQAAVVDEREKKLKNLKKKYTQIQKLKAQQDSGKVLEKNQIDKISTEKELLEEIAKLEV